MGITPVLQSESGERLESVEDPTNVLHRVLPDGNDPSFQCIKYIDWYGDTVFNYLQAPQFLAEWQSLESKKGDPEAVRVIDGIRRLAERLSQERHVYLKFYGD